MRHAPGSDQPRLPSFHRELKMSKRVAKIADIPAVWRDNLVSKTTPETLARTLRYEARLAYLDGRQRQAYKFNRYADIIEREAA